MFTIAKGLRNLTNSKYYQSVVYRVKVSKSCRYFRCTAQQDIKMYLEHENTHAYNIMISKGHAFNFNVIPEKIYLSKEKFEELMQSNWCKKSPNELFEDFSNLGAYCSEHNICISDTMFDTFIDNLTDNIKEASNEQLKELFYSLNKWPETESIRTRNFIEVWVALDDECTNRIRNMNFDEMLSFVALFYMLNVTKKSDFFNKAIQKLATKSKQLTPSQLIQAFFYVGIYRKPPFDMHNLEVALAENFSQFTIEEIAIMSMGFFKSKTPIRSMELVSRMIDLIIDNSKTINSLSLAALLKVIRYSMKITIGDQIYKLLETLQHEIPRLSLMCNVHLALLGTTTLTLHAECLNKIAQYSIEVISQTRLKDMERLVLTYGTFNFIPKTNKCLFTEVIKELQKPERDVEIIKYGRSFACCISYLGLLGIYPVDLISKALSAEFLEKTFGSQCFAYSYSILALHNFAELFYPTQEMNRLSKKSAIILAKKYTDFVPREDYKKQYNVTERMMLDVMNILKTSRGGNDYVIADHILTHHQRGDIIICNDHDGFPVPVQEIFSKEIFGIIKKPPNNNIWIVLVIAGRNVMIYNSEAPTGPFIAKVRELKTLGYHPVLVHWSLYSKLESFEEKLNYLNSLIKQTVSLK